MAGTRGTFQGNLQGTPSRPLEMLTSSKAVTASYALEAEKLSTAEVGGVSQSVYVSGGKPVAIISTIGSKTKPVYVSGGKFTPADDIPTIKTGSWDTAATWLAANSGSITGLTGSAADLSADVVLLVEKSASWDNSSNWVKANSASLLSKTSSLTISESLGTPAATAIQYTPDGGNKTINIKVPSTPAHIGAAPVSHTHSISDVTGLSNISSSVVRLESSASTIKTEVAKYVTTQSFNAYTSSAAAAVADAYLPLIGGTVTGDLVVNQNLTVKGTTVSIDAQNLNVKDKLILVASGSTTRAAADGAGMAVATASAGEGGAARIQYESAGNRFTSSVNFAAPGFTGSLRGNVVGNVTGTASFATSASRAISAASADSATSASYASNATNAISASEATHAITASWALDAKHANTASIALLANSATSASYANNATSATNATNATSASYANNSTTASYALVAETVKGGATVTSASEATHAISASHAAEVQWNSVTNKPSFYSASFQAGAFSAKTYGPTSGSQTINIPTTTTHITGLDAVTQSVKQMAAKSGSWDGVANTASAAYTQAVQAYASASLAKNEAASASYWKTEASKSAAAAASSATAASSSAASAATYANQSSTSAQLAAASASAAHTSKTRAAESASAAHTSKTRAAESASAASQSAYQAAVYAVSASASNTTIQQLAANVKQYYDNTTASAAQAATSATNAGTSATNAANAATRAGASASAASQSAYRASASAALLYKATGSATQPVYMTANGPTPANAYSTLFTNLVETKNVLTASVGGTTKYATINSASYANNSTTASYALIAESLKAGGSLVVDTASYAKTSSVAHTASFALDHYTPSTTALTPTSSVGNSAARTYIKTLTLDKNKHVVGFTTGSETVTNTDRYVNTAAFASTGSAGANGVKMTLTRAGSDTTQVTATIPVASTTAAGVMTGAQVTNLNSAVASASVAKTAMNWITSNSASALTKYHPLSGSLTAAFKAGGITSSETLNVSGAAGRNQYYRVIGSNHDIGFGIGTRNTNRGIYQFNTGSGGTASIGWLLLWDNTYTASFLAGYRVKADGFIGALQGNATSATRLVAASGSTMQPVYLSASGVPKACSGYVVTAAQTASWDAKQAAISDLATIRTNAASGNVAYGWGNHANAGYVKSSGVTSVTLTTASNYVSVDSAAAITTTGTRKIDLTAATKGKIESGSVAFGWGNHANAGYLKGVVPVANGGTGQTTSLAAINGFLTSLPSWSANPTDTTFLVRQDTGGANSFGRVTFGTVWNYVNGKTITSASRAVSAASADSATVATGLGVSTNTSASVAAAINAKWTYSEATIKAVKVNNATAADSATNATNATLAKSGSLLVASANADRPVLFTEGSGTANGNGDFLVNSAITFNPSTKILKVTNISSTTVTASTGFRGNLVGNVTGTASYATNAGTAASATNATNATNAVKLAGTSGSVGIPVYFNAGVPTACNANIVALPLSSSGATTGTLTLVPGKIHKCGTLTGNLTLALGTDNTYTHEAIYCCTFNMGATVRTITLPSGVKVMENSMDLDTPNCDYEINIMNNVAVIARTKES